MKNLRTQILETVKNNKIETPNRPQNMKTEDLVVILSKVGFEIQGENVIFNDVKVNEMKEVKRKGRPVNPNSKRQKMLEEKRMKKENGELRKGRPVNPNSKRQMRLKELEEKRQNGELRKGRPIDPNSKRQMRLNDTEAKPKGRPVNPNSKRQMRIKELEAKRKNGTLKKGRPAKNKCTDLILASRGY